MIATMILAHFVADYVLQWDGLARWKSERLSGVIAHGGIVLAVTWLLSLPYTRGWWPYALLIGLTHILRRPARQGLIRLRRGQIVVVNPQALREYVA
jgi:hypothetical protein